MAKYVYGPVPSRRLGQSLGVSPIPEKTCNYNCIYCQLGKTTNFINLRKHFFNPHDILREISQAIDKESKIDYITFVGEGEPLLSKDIGFLINETKKISDLPIALITNGALLSSIKVRDEVQEANVVIPTFDAGNSKLFRFINRPHKEIKFDNLVKGFEKFRKEFSNELWIEVMLIKGINDSEEILEEIKKEIDKFHPDKIQINTPSRPPSEPWVKIPDDKSLKLGQLILQSKQILPFNEVGLLESNLFKTPEDALFNIMKRHPLRYNQALEIISQFSIDNPENYLENLISNKIFKVLIYRNTSFIYRTEV